VVLRVGVDHLEGEGLLLFAWPHLCQVNHKRKAAMEMMGQTMNPSANQMLWAKWSGTVRAHHLVVVALSSQQENREELEHWRELGLQAGLELASSLPCQW